MCISNLAIDPKRLNELFEFDFAAGRMFWRPRPNAAQWNARYAGKEAFTARRCAYKHGSIDGRLYQAHRIIYAAAYGEWPALIDHINRDGSDNRLSNLRAADKALNSLNSKIRRDNTTGVKGVSWSKKRGAYRAYFSEGGKQEHLGFFATLEAAAQARTRRFSLSMEPR